jgi:hypothetical protein
MVGTRVGTKLPAVARLTQVVTSAIILDQIYLKVR